MFASAACFQQEFDVKVANFYQIFLAYRIVGQDIQALGQVQDDDPARLELAATLAQKEHQMQGAMRSMAQFRDQLTGVLEAMEQEAAAIADQHGEDSTEYEAHEQRRQGYVAVGESVMETAEKVLGDWDTRDRL